MDLHTLYFTMGLFILRNQQTLQLSKVNESFNGITSQSSLYKLKLLKQEIKQLEQIVNTEHKANWIIFHNLVNSNTEDGNRGLDNIKQATYSGFTAYATADRRYDFGELVIFDSTLYNEGNDYSTALSTYHCPVAGYYYFNVHLYISNWREAGATIMLDRLLTTSVLLEVAGGNIKGTTSVVVFCDVNQAVSVQCIHPGEFEGNDSGETSFSGFLIQEVTA